MSAFFEARLEARVAELEAMNAEQSRNLADLAQRLHTAEDDRDDYERRWLAECREHGATRRLLADAERELGCSCESAGACASCERFARDYPAVSQ